MVKRRKVLIGAGSLLAGAAAATGTGALSQASVDRGIGGRIANDTNGYVTLTKGFDNGDHVEFNDGEMYLTFGDLGEDGAGLNADSVNYFDSVFRVEINDDDEGPDGSFNNGGEPTMNEPENYYFWVTRSQALKDLNAEVSFYRAGGRSNSVMGTGNAQQPNSDNAGFWVGVKVDLDDSGYSPGQSIDIEDGFTVHVSDKAP